MKKFVILFFLVNVSVGSLRAQQIPDNNSEYMKWWRDARFGLFIHWGPVTLTGAEISWCMRESPWTKPNVVPEIYHELYKQFNPVKFDARQWVQYAKDAGMKYIMFVSKHHDGFVEWDSKLTEYKITNTPFGRDVLKELSDAAKEANMPFGVYFSPGDWHDKDCRSATNDVFVKRMHGYLTELLTRYDIKLLWFDYDGYPNPSFPEETATLVRKLKPGIILSNRLEPLHPDESHGRLGQWGDYCTPENRVGSYCDGIPWETCATLGKGWSWRSNDKPNDLRFALRTLIGCVGGDGNLLLNVGPNALGEFQADFVVRLREIGAWMKVNGESIYGTRGGPYTPTNDYACTRKGNTVYLHAFSFNGNKLVLPHLPAKVSSATLMDGSPVEFRNAKDSLTFTLEPQRQLPIVTLIKLTIDRDANQLGAISPPSTSGSLAYMKPAKVSSSIAPLFMHTASAALDDNPGTFWSLGRNDSVAATIIGKKFEGQHDPKAELWLKSGWLDVDLGAIKTVSRAVIQELPWGDYSPVTTFSIDCEVKGTWQTVATGTSIGKKPFEVCLSQPVTARKFRLSIKADGRPAIAEFQLFSSK
ncbi:MAG TPA: alpha-L-fucosidase [Bacteroidota bacterium]|nr:alpha-L-fucosidase [Bacteroidota bacterium]